MSGFIPGSFPSLINESMKFLSSFSRIIVVLLAVSFSLFTISSRRFFLSACIQAISAYTRYMLFHYALRRVNKSPIASRKNADEESKKLKPMMHPGVSEANLPLNDYFLANQVPHH